MTSDNNPKSLSVSLELNSDEIFISVILITSLHRNEKTGGSTNTKRQRFEFFCLTHWSQDKIGSILQTKCSNIFCLNGSSKYWNPKIVATPTLSSPTEPSVVITCHQWWQSWHRDDSRCSVNTHASNMLAWLPSRTVSMSYFVRGYPGRQGTDLCRLLRQRKNVCVRIVWMVSVRTMPCDGAGMARRPEVTNTVYHKVITCPLGGCGTVNLSLQKTTITFQDLNTTYNGILLREHDCWRHRHHKQHAGCPSPPCPLRHIRNT